MTIGRTRWALFTVALLVLLTAQELLAACPTNVPSGVTTCFYASSSGVDTNTGTDEQHPWLHIPGMTGCANNCSANTPSSGRGYILRGGDTWTQASLGINWQWSGTAANPIYIGVDPLWFAGASWVRPIFNCQNTSCGTTQYGNVIWLAGDYTTIDNIEMTGYQQSSSENMVGVYGNNNKVSNFYIHGWSRTAASSSVNSFALTNNWSGGGARGTIFDRNVIDGGDSPNKDFMGGILHGDIVSNNVVRYVYNAMNGVFNVISGNLVEYNYISTSGDHCNMVFPQDAFTSGTLYVYNNIIRHTGCGTTLFTLCAGGSSARSNAYVYNNVIYDTSAGSGQEAISACGTSNTIYVYNNTVETPDTTCMGNGGSGSSTTLHYSNNHCINTGIFCDPTGITACVNDGGNLQQTPTAAAAAGYTATETYVYSPTSSGSPTVGQATNRSSQCSGSLAALCSDTTYPEYDTVNHVVTFRTVNPRGSVWDIGAYQFAAGGPLSVVTASLPGGTQYQPYSQTLQATGGTPPYSWSVISGSLSPLNLSSAGAITGTPTSATTLSFTVRVTDSATPTPATVDQLLSIAVNAAPALAITTTTLPRAGVNQAYSQTLAATGGHPPYSWDVSAGSLSPLSLNSNGTIVGTAPASPTTLNFTARATDQEATADTQALSITVSNCNTSSGAWQNFAFAGQNQTLIASWNGIPSVATLNGLTSLSAVIPTQYSDMATAIRFNTDGTINALTGNANYVGTVAYSAGQTYHFRLNINVLTHTYSAYVTPPSLAEQTLGTDLPFRTEQQGITSLGYMGLYEASGTGSFQVCDFSVAGNASISAGKMSGAASMSGAGTIH